MRRTYRSKKDHGGTLDHKEVLLNMDEKSSTFDAYYIQNIKQTKRERVLSFVAPVNHIGVASNKVRKRKYVRRIVKEAELVNRTGTMSSSGYLTPDKSIRVNKVLDPFDMLLISSPACRDVVLDPFDMLLNSSPACRDVPKGKEDDIFEKILPKKESKTYTKTKPPKVKRLNYSTNSNCTDSDKENASDSQSNRTDIRTHELLVEKESSNSPKYSDESINKVVDNLSLRNLFKRKGFNGSFNTSYKSCKDRLTINSPIQQKSPLCSTPFKDKYRGVSIFKFSPISRKEENPKNVTISEEKEEVNSSTILVCKNVHDNNSQKCQPSPLALLPNHSIQLKPKLSSDEIDSNSNGSMHGNNSKIEHIDNETEYEPNSVTNVGQSYFQTTEDEPFLGFSNNEAEIDTTNKCSQHESLKENNSIGDKNIDNNEIDLKIDVTTEDESENISSSSTSNKYTPMQSSIGSQSQNGESLYDTCSEQNSLVDDYKHNKEPIVAVEKMSDSIFLKYYTKMLVEFDDEEMSEETHESDYEDMSKQTEYDDFESLANDSIEDVLNNNSSSAESDCVDIKPNTIVITDSSTTEDLLSSNDEDVDNENGQECVSFVTTRRKNEITNDSMFLFDHSYGSNSTDCDKTVLSNIKVNLDKSDVTLHIKNTSEYNLSDENTNLKGYVKKDCDSSETDSSEIGTKMSTRKSLILSSQSNNNDSVNAIHDLIQTDSTSDARISRITTRKSSKLPRRSVVSSPTLVGANKMKSSNEVIRERKAKISTRKSAKLPKRSYFSSSELNDSENEMTLIESHEGNNAAVVENRKTGSDSNYSKKGDAELSLTNKSAPLMSKPNDLMNHPDQSSYAGTEVKQAIVLQPGKKWERSLSIYRRMSMVADHFDHSILDDECLQKKGRKYRQSVISTMEMQECKDSLHNDSINSRRSTFISKPSRPTIRFVKDPNISRVSLNTSLVFDDLKGFLNEECDDTVIELSKLSIADSEHEVTIINNFHESERLTTARDYVLRRCNQTEPILFDDCYPETVLKNCHKIGEGVYGEVFLWRGRDGRARVMKIVPIAGTVKVNGEDQKDFHEIISEIVIAMELSALRAPIADIDRQLDEGNDIHALDLHAIENATDTFNEVLAVRCVYGAYPSRLLDLWELYDECKGSENDSPAALPTDQRFIVLELANAGQDLESYQFASAQQAHALFQQIAFGLAVGEEAFQFEHRDLHWGNVLIAPTDQKLATFILRGRTHRTARCGVAATIIDYSLSRLTLPLAADSAALYNDLATDDQLFDAVGDYQFEVYRLMRDKLGNDWKNFEPYTNILWLHYTVDKMITALRYKRTNTKIHKHYIEKLKGIKNRILEYGSAVEYVLADIEF